MFGRRGVLPISKPNRFHYQIQLDGRAGRLGWDVREI